MDHDIQPIIGDNEDISKINYSNMVTSSYDVDDLDLIQSISFKAPLIESIGQLVSAPKQAPKTPTFGNQRKLIESFKELSQALKYILPTQNY